MLPTPQYSPGMHIAPSWFEIELGTPVFAPTPLTGPEQ